jgi:hypothetical protein
MRIQRGESMQTKAVFLKKSAPCTIFPAVHERWIRPEKALN